MEDQDQKEEWCAGKGLFRWYFKDNGETINVEERVVVFLARSFDHALELAEAEAVQYCAEEESANFRIEPLEWWEAYRIDEERLMSGTEVYSRLASTSLSGEAFLKRYYPKSHDRGSA